MDEAAKTTFVSTLEAGAGDLGVPLSPAQIDACVRFTDLLLDANTRVNLTRITQPAEIAIKHFVDSLTLLSVCSDIAPGATLVDVGTGAGFPGVVVKIVRPDLRLVLLDSLRKRLDFLQGVVEALGLNNVSLVHARAEEAGRDPARRDGCDVVAARAVAALPTLLEWCAPLVRPGGIFVALKSGGVDDELTGAAEVARDLRVRLIRDAALTLPPIAAGEEPPRRRVLVYEKTGPTPPRFPRPGARIKASKVQ